MGMAEVAVGEVVGKTGKALRARLHNSNKPVGGAPLTRRNDRVEISSCDPRLDAFYEDRPPVIHPNPELTLEGIEMVPDGR